MAMRAMLAGAAAMPMGFARVPKLGEPPRLRSESMKLICPRTWLAEAVPGRPGQIRARLFPVSTMNSRIPSLAGLPEGALRLAPRPG